VIGELRLAWRLAKGYRLRPWDSPYLKWRIETWAGLPAESVQRENFWRFVWVHRRDLMRYLKWASRNQELLKGPS
jgi:hypothetical protein